MGAFQQLNISILHLDWMFFLLPMPFFVGMLLDALAWKTLLPRTPGLKLSSLFGPHIGAEAVLLSIPGGFAMADAIKIFLLKRRTNVQTGTVMASLIMRHWMLGMTQLLFITGGCLLGGFLTHEYFQTDHSNDQTLIGAIGILISISVLLGIIVRQLVRGTLARTLWKLLYRIKIASLRTRLKSAASSCKQLDIHFAEAAKHEKLSLAAVFGMYLIHWFMDVGESLLVAHALGIPISFVNILFTEAILSAVRLGVFFLPNGAIVKDLGYVAIFASLHLPVSAVQVAGFVLLKRIISIVCIGIGYTALVSQGFRWNDRKLLSLETVLEHR